MLRERTQAQFRDRVPTQTSLVCVGVTLDGVVEDVHLGRKKPVATKVASPMAEPPLTRGEMLKIYLERAERLKRQEEIARLNPAATALRIALADFKVQFREHLDRRMRVELSVSDDGPSGSVPASY